MNPNEEDVDALGIACQKKSEEFTDLLLSKFEQMDEDPVGVAYCIWAFLIYYLTEAGFQEKELVRELKGFIKFHNSDGTET